MRKSVGSPAASVRKMKLSSNLVASSAAKIRRRQLSFSRSYRSADDKVARKTMRELATLLWPVGELVVTPGTSRGDRSS